MPSERCLRWAMTVNAAVATRPMKTRPTTETMSTIVAGEKMESSGVGAVTTADLGMTSPSGGRGGGVHRLTEEDPHLVEAAA